MMYYKVVLTKNNIELASKVKLGDSFVDRLVGLMFKKEMVGYDGLLLEPSMSIHNLFVFFPIDVIFLSKENKVVKVIKNFKPWRISGIYPKARRVLELKQGAIKGNIDVGDQIEVSRV